MTTAIRIIRDLIFLSLITQTIWAQPSKLWKFFSLNPVKSIKLVDRCSQIHDSQDLMKTLDYAWFIVGENLWAYEVVMVDGKSGQIIFPLGCHRAEMRTSKIFFKRTRRPYHFGSEFSKKMKKKWENLYKKENESTVIEDADLNEKESEENNERERTTEILADEVSIALDEEELKKSEWPEMVKASVLNQSKGKTIENKTHSGVNVPEPQSQSEDVFNDTPFVNVFKTARPPKEYFRSHPQSGFMKSGKLCVKPKQRFRTFFYTSAKKENIYEGQYSLLYQGHLVPQILSMGKVIKCDKSSSHLPKNYKEVCFQVNPNWAKEKVAGVQLVFSNKTDKTQCLTDIRVILPGGVCLEEGKELRHERNRSLCKGVFKDYSDVEFTKERVEFTPQAIQFYKNFKTIRFMNFTTSSPRVPKKCENLIKQGDDNYELSKEASDCLFLDKRDWKQRAHETDLTYGQSHKTPKEYWKGVPIEVVIRLANLTETHPWFVLPHNATDEYIKEVAKLFSRELKPSLVPRIEFSNEVWNGLFWGSKYIEQLGRLSKDYQGLEKRWQKTAAAYVDESIRVFKLWEEAYQEAAGDLSIPRKFLTVLATQQSSATYTRYILEHVERNGFLEKLDAIATATYFYGCWGDEKGGKCKTPWSLRNVQNLDQLFDLLLFKKNPKGLIGVYSQLQKQNAVLKDFSSKKEKPLMLFSYEGGQHLGVKKLKSNYSPHANVLEERARLNKLFRQADKDPRMGTLYLILQGLWQKVSPQGDFIWFVAPQTDSKYGTFGLSESIKNLNSSKVKAVLSKEVLSFPEWELKKEFE